MAKVTPINEHFQYFLDEMKETFWGDRYGQTRQAWQRFLELESERQRDRFTGWAWHGNQASVSGFDLEPPDQGLCTDLTFVMEAINLASAVYDATSHKMLSGPVYSPTSHPTRDATTTHPRSVGL
ncbi:MAG TPA: hypothetical protein VEI52_16045 [Terriglobales bacterium]|nr:hypothetical protein [Terriglobales bacterium]